MNESLKVRRGDVLLKYPKQVFLCSWEVAPHNERGQALESNQAG